MVTNRALRGADAMKARILRAVGEMIVRDGLSSVGINALARQAGCDKVLIYRYFGDLDGVYSAYAAKGGFWWSLADLTGDIDPSRQSLAETLKTLFRRHGETLRSRPVTLAVLAAELTERTPLVAALEGVRERRTLELVEWIATNYPTPRKIDLAAITMVLGVAVNYLAVRARALNVMSGIPIGDDAGWRRIYVAIDAVLDAVAEQP